jgi:hypothetical protein
MECFFHYPTSPPYSVLHLHASLNFEERPYQKTRSRALADVVAETEEVCAYVHACVFVCACVCVCACVRGLAWWRPGHSFCCMMPLLERRLPTTCARFVEYAGDD